jgi:hypothetical protein
MGIIVRLILLCPRLSPDRERDLQNRRQSTVRVIVVEAVIEEEELSVPTIEML